MYELESVETWFQRVPCCFVPGFPTSTIMVFGYLNEVITIEQRKLARKKYEVNFETKQYVTVLWVMNDLNTNIFKPKITSSIGLEWDIV